MLKKDVLPTDIRFIEKVSLLHRSDLTSPTIGRREWKGDERFVEGPETQLGSMARLFT